MLPVGEGHRFCVRHRPVAGDIVGTIVHVPAFAEEMNRSRHLTARAARQLAGIGYDVLHTDPIGCGDSPGDFGDATWEQWVRDVVATAEWAHADRRPLWLFGLRAGALVAAAALSLLPPTTSLLLWQPVVSGRTHLVQFLRLKLAGGMVSEEERVGTKHLLERISRGESIDVAGYKISPALANGLATAELAVPAGYSGRVVWLEVVAADAGMPPAAQATMTSMTAAGARVDAATVRGPSFWQSVELEDCPELTTATLTSFAMRDGIELDRRTAVL